MHRLKLKGKKENNPSIMEHHAPINKNEQKNLKLDRLNPIVTRFEKFVLKMAEKEVKSLLSYFTNKLRKFTQYKSTISLSARELDNIEEQLEMLNAGFSLGISQSIKDFMENELIKLQGNMNNISALRWDYSSFKEELTRNNNFNTMNETSDNSSNISENEEILEDLAEDDIHGLEVEDADLGRGKDLFGNTLTQNENIISNIEGNITTSELTSPSIFENVEDKLESIDKDVRGIESKKTNRPEISFKNKFSAKFTQSSKLHSNFLDFQTANELAELESNKKGAMSQIMPESMTLFTNGDKSLAKLLCQMDQFLVGLEREVDDIALENQILGDVVEMSSSQRTEKWMKARSCRLTSSNFGKAFNRKSLTSMEKFVRSFFDKFDSSKIPALKYGTETESKAFTKYRENLKSGEDAIETGFWVNKKYFWLGGSPDGFKMSNKKIQRTLEIKCPYNGKDLEIEDLVETRSQNGKFFLVEDENLKYCVNPKHNYMCQIQGVMEIVDINYCDFIVYTSKDFYVTTEKRNQEFINEMFEKLKMIYFRFLLPNFCRREDYNAGMPEYKEISQEIYEKKYK